ncbi:hypothetical protein U9R90_15410 [Streptomyces sp. E11-3]
MAEQSREFEPEVREGAVLVLPGDRADAVFTTHHVTGGQALLPQR